MVWFIVRLGLVYSLFVIGVLLLLVVLGCYGCLLFGLGRRGVSVAW